MHVTNNISSNLAVIAISLNRNGLLVMRQIDNISPGGAPGGKLVSGSHKRCELGHKVIRHFSRGDHKYVLAKHNVKQQL